MYEPQTNILKTLDSGHYSVAEIFYLLVNLSIDEAKHNAELQARLITAEAEIAKLKAAMAELIVVS